MHLLLYACLNGCWFSFFSSFLSLILTLQSFAFSWNIYVSISFSWNIPFETTFFASINRSVNRWKNTFIFSFPKMFWYIPSFRSFVEIQSSSVSNNDALIQQNFVIGRIDGYAEFWKAIFEYKTCSFSLNSCTIGHNNCMKSWWILTN